MNEFTSKSLVFPTIYHQQTLVSFCGSSPPLHLYVKGNRVSSNSTFYLQLIQFSIPSQYSLYSSLTIYMLEHNSLNSLNSRIFHILLLLKYHNSYHGIDWTLDFHERTSSSPYWICSRIIIINTLTYCSAHSYSPQILWL